MKDLITLAQAQPERTFSVPPAIGFVPAPTTPEEYDKILRDQIETLSKVAKDAGLRAH